MDWTPGKIRKEEAKVRDRLIANGTSPADAIRRAGQIVSSEIERQQNEAYDAATDDEGNPR